MHVLYIHKPQLPRHVFSWYIALFVLCPYSEYYHDHVQVMPNSN